MKKPKNDFFEEAYEISIDYKKSDGYWVCNHKIYVEVPVKHGINEKGNHDKALEMAKILYPGCRINSVTYC